MGHSARSLKGLLGTILMQVLSTNIMTMRPGFMAKPLFSNTRQIFCLTCARCVNGVRIFTTIANIPFLVAQRSSKNNTYPLQNVKKSRGSFHKIKKILGLHFFWPILYKYFGVRKRALLSWRTELTRVASRAAEWKKILLSKEKLSFSSSSFQEITIFECDSHSRILQAKSHRRKIRVSEEFLKKKHIYTLLAKPILKRFWKIR